MQLSPIYKTDSHSASHVSLEDSLHSGSEAFQGGEGFRLLIIRLEQLELQTEMLGV